MAIIDLGKVVGKDGANAMMEIATKEKAGAVRIGDDFNINSENGTISIDTAFSAGLSGYQEFAPSESPKTIFGKILSSLKYLKENAASSVSSAKVLDGTAAYKMSIAETFPETNNPGWYLINVTESSGGMSYPISGKNVLLHVEAVTLPEVGKWLRQTLYEISLDYQPQVFIRHQHKTKQGIVWTEFKKIQNV